MSYFIAIAIIFIATFSVCFLTKKQFGVILPIVNFSVIIFLYLFGLFDLLMVGLYVWLLAVLTLFVISLVKIIKTKEKAFIKEFFSPAVLFFLGFCGLQFIMLLKIKAIWWDEFTHWGLVVKNMFYHHNFGGGETATTMFKGYPVGTSLFLFFFQCFGLKFSDNILFMALNFLNISLLLPVLSKIKENGKKICVGTILVLCCIVLNYRFLFTLYNDMFLALCFCFILCSYFCFKRDGFGVSNFVAIGFASFVLCIAKSTGVALCGFACVIMLIDFFISNGFKQTFKSKQLYVFITVLAFSILTSKLSWSLHLKMANNPSAWQTSSLTFKNILTYLTNPTEFQRSVTSNFFLCMLVPLNTNGKGGHLPLSFLMFAIIIVLLSLNLKKQIGKKQSIGVMISTLLCFLIWVFSLLILYLFSFSESDANSLFCLIRYVGTFGSGIVMFLVIYSFSECKIPEFMNFKKRGILICASFISLVCVICNPIFANVTNKRYSEYETFSSLVSVLDKNDKVFIINCDIQEDDEITTFKQDWKDQDNITTITRKARRQYVYMHYIATPIQTSGLLVGGSPHQGNMWTDSVSFEETTMLIKRGNYNYVYLHNITDEFKTNFRELFNEEPTEKTMFKVSLSGDNLILTKV